MRARREESFWRRAGALTVVVGLGVGACTSTSADSGDDSSDVAGSGATIDGGVAPPTGVVDRPGCDPDTIGEEDGPLVGVLAIDDGIPTGTCFGTPDPTLLASWEELARITPPADLALIDLLAGFDAPDGETLAFAAITGEFNDQFTIAVNIPLAEADTDELRITLAHEMSHVFGQTPDQLDVSIGPQDCETLYNGNGCFTDDALVLAWIDEFWVDDGYLAMLPGLDAVDDAGGDERCAFDPAFLGAYAASHPEEDLAESFSAFVFDIYVDPAAEARLRFFERYPDLVAYRDQVTAADIATPPNRFEPCG